MNGQENNPSGRYFSLIMTVCIVLVITTFVGWPLSSKARSNYENRVAELRNKLTDTKIPEIESEYEKVKSEIQMRLEHENSLFLYQFILMGAVFAFVLSRPGLFKGLEERKNILKKPSENGLLILTLGISAIPLLIVDVHIRYNSMVIEMLGKWTQKYYEFQVPPPAMGWEAFWSGSENYHFYRYCPDFFAPILFAMLYLPAISILLGYYILLFRQCPPASTKLNIQKIVFGGVQLAILLFFVINHWPIHYGWPSCWGWLIVISWLMSWSFISWRGCAICNAEISNVQKKREGDSA